MLGELRPQIIDLPEVVALQSGDLGGSVGLKQLLLRACPLKLLSQRLLNRLELYFLKLLPPKSGLKVLSCLLTITFEFFDLVLKVFGMLLMELPLELDLVSVAMCEEICCLGNRSTDKSSQLKFPERAWRSIL